MAKNIVAIQIELVMLALISLAVSYLLNASFMPCFGTALLVGIQYNIIFRIIFRIILGTGASKAQK